MDRERFFFREKVADAINHRDLLKSASVIFLPEPWKRLCTVRAIPCASKEYLHILSATLVYLL